MLLRVKLEIAAAALVEFFVCAPLQQVPALNYEDLIGAANRA